MGCAIGRQAEFVYSTSVKKELYENLPESPGVYLMRGERNKLLYVGKAGNLRRRVGSYFQKAHDGKTEKLVSEIRKIDVEQTETAIEALILEAELIKKYKPPYNMREKDDKSFLYVEITREEWPRVLLVRGRDRDVRSGKGIYFGPFTSATSIRQALKVIRRIFPYNTHPMKDVGKLKRPCLDYEIKQCPGTCVGEITKTEYRKNIRHIKMFLEGKKARVVASLKREMQTASKSMDYERAAKLRGKIFALEHIQDVAFIERDDLGDPGVTAGRRIEGYDISNISGTAAVGSMVVFTGGRADKNEYRKFKIRTVRQPDDVGMLREMLTRRFAREDWAMPDLLLIDGGKGQVNVAKEVLAGYGLKIPVVGLAKGAKRDRNDVIGVVPLGVKKETLISVRDEAHRFAIKYHKEIRKREFLRK